MAFQRQISAGSGFGRKTPFSWALAAAFGVAMAASAPPFVEKAMAADCGLTVQQDWLEDLVATATASGECGLATIDLVVSDGVDEVVWSASYRSGDLFGFDDIAHLDAMGVALGDWLGSYADMTRSSTLPEWPEGAGMPDAGEFPFYVTEDLSQQDYLDIRAADYPMVCYVQGRESTLCLVRLPGAGALVSVGAQSFPG